MRHDYPVEQLLRPPIELYGAVVHFAAAALCVLLPGVFLLPGNATWVMAAIFAILGIARLRDALGLRKYQYQLYQLPGYRVESRAIPTSRQLLFFGLGFPWRAYHTQRRADLERSEWRRVTEYEMSSRYRLARRLENWIPFLPTRWSHHWNPVAPKPVVEGEPTLHGVGIPEGEDEICLPQSERTSHVFVVGTTRVGKTRLAEVLISQDIRNGDAVIVFDPKGDADLLARVYHEARAAGRLKHFSVFHLGFPELSARYNPISDFARITEVATRIASQLPGEGQSAAFREFTWRYVNVIAKALTELGKSASYETLLAYGSDIDPLLEEYLQHLFQKYQVPNWESRLRQLIESDQKPDRNAQGRSRKAWAAVQMFKEIDLTDMVGFSLVKTFEYDKSFYDKLVASLFPLLEKLTSGAVGKLLSPDYTDLADTRPIIDWRTVIDQGGIVYVGLDALTDAEVASAVGSSMFADLTSTAGSIYKNLDAVRLPDLQGEKRARHRVCIHADEFNELVGKEFVPLCNKAGGAGFMITAYTQTLSDIEVRFGDKAKAGQVIGNLGTLIMLRVKEPATAELLTKQLREVEVKHLELQSLVTDSSNPESGVDFVSRSGQTLQRQRVPMVHPHDVLNLPKGHAFALIGGTLYKLRLPLFKPEPDLPDSLRQMTAHMRESPREPRDDWAQLPDMLVAQ